MRKPYSQVSTQAKKVMSIAQAMNLKYYGDTNWSIAEASTMETPIGIVHLHWTSHRGIGKWNIISNPKWRGEICGTPRCRRVTIEPLGGENESVNLRDKSLEELSDEWLWTQWGACCYWPRDKFSNYPPYIHRLEKWQDKYEIGVNNGTLV